jgi:hypothetical protein
VIRDEIENKIEIYVHLAGTIREAIESGKESAEPGAGTGEEEICTWLKLQFDLRTIASVIFSPSHEREERRTL